jgi:hypothetical protein
MSRETAIHPATLPEAQAAKARAIEIFGPLAEGVGVRITRFDSGYGLKINLGSESEQAAQLPTDIEGVPVRAEVGGSIRKVPG